MFSCIWTEKNGIEHDTNSVKISLFTTTKKLKSSNLRLSIKHFLALTNRFSSTLYFFPRTKSRLITAIAFKAPENPRESVLAARRAGRNNPEILPVQYLNTSAHVCVCALSLRLVEIRPSWGRSLPTNRKNLPGKTTTATHCNPSLD